jgi:hypothetical protein
MTEEEKTEPLTVLPPPPPPAEEVKVEEKPKEKTASIVERIIENLEQTYREEKAKEIQNLYNAFVDAITSQSNPHISNILTALELVKQDVVSQKLEQIRREQGGT